MPVSINRLTSKLGAEYFNMAAPFIKQLVDRIRVGQPLQNVLRNFDGRLFTERVVEYPYFVSWLLDGLEGEVLLDVGGVLNNDLVVDVIKERCSEIIFCNAGKEPEIFGDSSFAHYLISEIEKAVFAEGAFSLVTCLSTIEHIGFDNSQYGIKTPARYSMATDEPLLQVAALLAKALVPGGRMLLSFPYGKREVIEHPATKKIASQVFGVQSIKLLRRMLRELGVKMKIDVFQAQSNGWIKVTPTTCSARYAENCPAAAAVALISGVKGG